MIIPVPHPALVEVQDTMDQLTGLHRVPLDQSKALLKGMIARDLSLERFAEGQNARHDVAEIMSQPHGKQG